MSSEKVIQIKDLVVEYKSGNTITRAVDKVNLDICSNEMTIILGSSGCGKTSLLNCVGGMLTPTSGQILWNGKDITKFNDSQKTEYRRDAIGYIFQQYNLIPDLTASENIETAACLIKDPPPTIEMLDIVNLQNKGNNYPSQMSGGEQQRVCIARAIGKRPQVLLCDEPTGALDTKNAIMVMQILQDLATENGIPVVVITHNPEFADLANHYVLIRDGKIIEEKNQDNPKKAKDLEFK